MNTLDDILPEVVKPARYTGGEWNSVVKDWDSVDVRMLLAYPDLYEIGMSNLGLAILYHLLNERPDILAERAYAPWTDMEAEMRQAGIPLFSLESKHPLKDFDIIGFSLGYELTYTNVLNMLDLAGIPTHSARRDESYPLVIAGGSCALNAEPMADFFDLFVLGEGEEVVLELVDCFRRWKAEGTGDKQQLLEALSRIEGLYVPDHYSVSYNDDNTIADIKPSAAASPCITRRILADLPPAVTNPVVPFISTIHDRGAIEIQRGCTRGCRFCQAGMIYRPVRERKPQEVLEVTEALLRNCGYSEMSLLSLSTSDYSQIESLAGALSLRYRERNVKISLPSLRIDHRSIGLLDSLTTGKKSGLTFAPEAGSERLRSVINKNLSEADLHQTLNTASGHGWGSVKLYFMLGLPTESQGDIDGIVHLIRHSIAAFKAGGRRPLHLKVSASPFVPKAHTPFQWVPQLHRDELEERVESLRHGLKRLGVRLSWQDPRMSHLEAVLARGDRHLSTAIHRAWESGATFDSWSERFDYDRWLKAFDECGIDPAFYANRQRPLDETLPWSHIDAGVSADFLKQEYLNSLNNTATEDCRFGRCNSCGLELRHPTCRANYQSSSS